MVLHIERVETDMEVTGPEARTPLAPALPPRAPEDERAWIERLRPLVVRILEEELHRYLRRLG